MEEIEMEGTSYLTIAYLGMIAALAIWTWTVVVRSRSIETRLEAVESSIGIDVSQADEFAAQSSATVQDDATV
ncbi:MAG: hypothetical protein ACI8T6_000369 [Candidatus Poseidoniaceae archaeon]|jgi:hypothetical protein|tara:strand:+ start:4883 stop:5101 length:219 start_codon:yes stop_codon:yes gene_type:complete